MGEEQNLDDDQHRPQNKKPDHFPARESGKIMAEKKERKTNRRNNSGQARARKFEFQVSADDSAKQKQRRQRRDPERELLEAGRVEGDSFALESRLAHEIDDRFSDSIGQQRLAVDFFCSLLRAEREHAPFRVNDAVADFDLLILVHERFAAIRIVTVLDGGTAKQRD